VMPRLGNVKAWIETVEDETPFEEHNTSTQEGKRAECFIESKTGAGFNVVVHLTPDYRFEGHNMLAIELHVDGQAVDNMLFGHPDMTGRFRGGVISPTSLRPFQFGATVFTEDAGTEQDGYLSGLGSITVRIYRCMQINGHPPPFHSVNLAFTKEKAVHETAKKALLTHSVTFGEPIHTQEFGFVSVEDLDPREQPFCTFVFQYRSREILEAMDILPPARDSEHRSIGPQTTEDDNDVDPDAAEIRRLENRLRDLKKRVKQEDREATVVDLSGRGPKKQKKEVIDLTL